MASKYGVKPNEVGPFEDGIELTDFSADIDIYALFGQEARAIEVVAASNGSLVVVTPGSARQDTPTTRTFAALAAGTWIGGNRGLQVSKIVASGTTGVTRIRVWL
jgi:hypothetical protein